MSMSQSRRLAVDHPLHALARGLDYIGRKRPRASVRDDRARERVSATARQSRRKLDRLLIQRDPVIRRMLDQLGATIEEARHPFTPEGGGDSEAGKAVIRRIFAGGAAMFDQLLDARRTTPQREPEPE